MIPNNSRKHINNTNTVIIIMKSRLKAGKHNDQKSNTRIIVTVTATTTIAYYQVIETINA